MDYSKLQVLAEAAKKERISEKLVRGGKKFSDWSWRVDGAVGSVFYNHIEPEIDEALTDAERVRWHRILDSFDAADQAKIWHCISGTSLASSVRAKTISKWLRYDLKNDGRVKDYIMDQVEAQLQREAQQAASTTAMVMAANNQGNTYNIYAY